MNTSKLVKQWNRSIFDFENHVKAIKSKYYRNEDVKEDVSNIMKFIDLINKNIPPMQ